MVEPEVEEKVEPAPLQVALLYKLLKVQRETLEFLQSTTPEGINVLVFDDTVEPGVKGINLVKEYPYHRLFKAEIINKGLNIVYARINNEKEVPIEPEETIVFEKSKALIEYISLRVIATTKIKILGRY